MNDFRCICDATPSALCFFSMFLLNKEDGVAIAIEANKSVKPSLVY